MANAQVQNYEPIQGLPAGELEGVFPKNTMSESADVDIPDAVNPTNNFLESVTVSAA